MFREEAGIDKFLRNKIVHKTIQCRKRNVLMSINKCALDFLLVECFTEDQQIWYHTSAKNLQNMPGYQILTWVFTVSMKVVLKSKLQKYSKTKVTLKLAFSSSSCNFTINILYGHLRCLLQAIIRRLVDLT